MFRLDDEKLIGQARDILAGVETSKVHVQGRVVPEKSDHNPDRNVHLDPGGSTFFDQADEDCDASAHYVAVQLDRVGEQGFLPDGIWAPARSKITRELDT
ncbi:calmodulin [Kitasatospora sp. CB02891]|uniref:BP74-related protein n=1 Tax=Kitasatospora sp. CB02891 TaxID=2020329 RepID=UPI000C270395|nr:calmodulin [Kitasatospora sp. CB02891]PJN23828.1 calmodulin [Kitasatospora sp. CB02891]